MSASFNQTSLYQEKLMALKPVDLTSIPEETARVAKAAFPKSNIYLKLRDELGAPYQDETFSHLFPSAGCPAESPGRLAMITVFQFAEGLSDRAAADAVRSRIDWKYALGLELTDPGFDATVLVEFRTRLNASDQARLLFETLLERLREAKLVKARGRQRTDSTRVLAGVHAYNRLECVWEAMRWALNSLAQVVPKWLGEQASVEWYERYGRRPEAFRLTDKERLALLEQIGADGHRLLDAIYRIGIFGLDRLPAVEILRQIWVQQYYVEDGTARFRQSDNHPAAREMIYSPYDPDARLGVKGEAEWQGYKVHLTETIEPDGLQLITDVQTDVAPATDREALPKVQACLAQRDLLPEQHLVDGGYMTAGHLVDSRRDRQINMLGPVKEDGSWQAKAGKGFAVSNFKIDWENKQAICPEGKVSGGWQEARATYEMEIVHINFLKKDCSVCPSMSDCTKSKGQRRTITVNARPYHEALQEARARQQTPEFKKQYQARAGIEGTISQAVRVTKLRKTRYRGLIKTRLQHYATAAAINILRLGAWWLGPPREQTRVSPFLALAPQAA
jgi:transposase